MSGAQVCPARNTGRGGVAGGGFALACGWTLHICIKNTPDSRLKITSPWRSGVWQSVRKSGLRAREGKREGRTGEGSDGRRQSSVRMPGSAPG